VNIMALETLTQLERLGFPDLLLWLLTFAIVYGVLSQIKMPKSAASRAIIGIVSGLFVLMFAPATLISIISKMSTNLILLVLGLLVVIIFLEASGVKVAHGEIVASQGGKPVYVKNKKVSRGAESVFRKHSVEFGILILILVALVFIGSGGLSILGIQNINFSEGNILPIGVIVLVLLAVLFLYSEKSGDEGEE